MKYRTQEEVADTIRRIADGTASADPLQANDRAELERIAAHVEELREEAMLSRAYLERAVVSAYSLGARHALEHTQAAVTALESAYQEKIEVLEQMLAVYEPDGATSEMDRERINLGTGEITLDDGEHGDDEQS